MIRRGLRDRLIRRFVDPDRTPAKPFKVADFGSEYSEDRASFVDG